jgi:hypothetical protein
MNAPDKVSNLVERMREAGNKVPKPLEVLDVAEKPISAGELKNYAFDQGLKFKQKTNELVEKVDTTGLTQEEVGKIKVDFDKRFAELLSNNEALVNKAVAEAIGDAPVAEQVKVEEPVNMGYSEQQPMSMEQAQEVPVSQKVEVQPKKTFDMGIEDVSKQPKIEKQVDVIPMKFPEDENAPKIQPKAVQENSVVDNQVVSQAEATQTISTENTQKKTFDLGMEDVTKGPGKGARFFNRVSESISNGYKNAIDGFYKLDDKINKLDGKIAAFVKNEVEIAAFAAQPIKNAINEGARGVVNFANENIAFEEFRPWKIATGESFVAFAKRKGEQYKAYNEKQNALHAEFVRIENERSAAEIARLKEGVKTLFKNLIGFATGTYKSAVEAKNEIQRSYTNKKNALKYEILKTLQNASVEATVKIEKKMKAIEFLDSKILLIPEKTETVSQPQSPTEQAPVVENQIVESPIQQETIVSQKVEKLPVENNETVVPKIPETVSESVWNNFVDNKSEVPRNILVSIADKIKKGEQYTDRELAIASQYGEKIKTILNLEKINGEEKIKMDAIKEEIALMEKNLQFASGDEKTRKEKYIAEAKGDLVNYQKKWDERNGVSQNNAPEQTPIPVVNKALEDFADEAQLGGYNAGAFANMMNQAKVAEEQNNTNG